MKFTEHKDPSINVVRRIEDNTIWVNDQPLTGSFYMTQRHLQPQWDIRHFDQLTEAHLEALLALDPELILLGTGARQHFLPPALQALVLGRGVGIETMRNDAACRTWNVLTTEDRPVVLAVIMDGKTA